MKKNTVTVVVCMIFTAVLTAVNAYAAGSAALMRDILGYVYGALAAAAMIWLYTTGKKQVDPEPGRFAVASREYFYCGVAVLGVSVSSFIGIFAIYNNFYLDNLDTTTQGPFLTTHMIFSLLGFVAGLLLLAAGAVKKSAFKAFSTAFTAIWGFSYVVSECTSFIPLPDISLYLPRLGSAVFVTLSFCYITMSGVAGLQRNAAGLRACAGMTMIFSISDAVFWLIYHKNVYREMLLTSLLFAVLFGLYFTWLSLTLDRKFRKSAEVTGNEI